MQITNICLPTGKYLLGKSDRMDVSLLMEGDETNKQCLERFVADAQTRIQLEQRRVEKYQAMLSMLDADAK